MLSLVSHTNVGKTTLARTLLGRDIGEVRDAPHVTEFAEEFVLLRTDTGDELILADTPGFGDSVRLAKRLRQSGNPIGWFLAEVWDRWRDRSFWLSQQALRQVRERADAVLYLVSASEPPASAGYVKPEMEILAWVGKPVLVLLNQMGAPRDAAAEAADVQLWQTHLVGVATGRRPCCRSMPSRAAGFRKARSGGRSKRRWARQDAEMATPARRVARRSGWPHSIAR